MKNHVRNQKVIDFVESATMLKKLTAEELTEYVSDGGSSEATIKQLSTLISMLTNATKLIEAMDEELAELNTEISELKSKR